MSSEKITPYEAPNLKPYQPFGIPLLKLLFGLAALSLIITAAYEVFF